jgi:hypothetical protein
VGKEKNWPTINKMLQIGYGKRKNGQQEKECLVGGFSHPTMEKNA